MSFPKKSLPWPHCANIVALAKLFFVLSCLVVVVFFPTVLSTICHTFWIIYWIFLYFFHKLREDRDVNIPSTQWTMGKIQNVIVNKWIKWIAGSSMLHSFSVAAHNLWSLGNIVVSGHAEGHKVLIGKGKTFFPLRRFLHINFLHTWKIRIWVIFFLIFFSSKKFLSGFWN